MLFENLNNGLFSDVARPMGCDEIRDSRGLAIADLNNDGKLDMVVANNANPPTIFLNRLKSSQNFLRISLTGDSKHNRDSIGARVQVNVKTDSGYKKMSRWVEAGSGYCSQSDSRLHFGLGSADEIESIEVDWPDGSSTSVKGNKVKVNSQINIPKQNTAKGP